MPWQQATLAKVYTIISIADFSRIASRDRAMSFSMRRVEARYRRSSHFGIAFGGGRGIGGNGGKLSWRHGTGRSRIFSISRHGHRSKKRVE